MTTNTRTRKATTAAKAASAPEPKAPAKKTPEQSAADKELMYANGLRAARELKGYGRVQVAAALGITTSAWWNLEFNGKGDEVTKTLAKVQALPQAGKPRGPLAVTKPAPTGKGKAQAADLI